MSLHLLDLLLILVIALGIPLAIILWVISRARNK